MTQIYVQGALVLVLTTGENNFPHCIPLHPQPFTLAFHVLNRLQSEYPTTPNLMPNLGSALVFIGLQSQETKIFCYQGHQMKFPSIVGLLIPKSPREKHLHLSTIWPPVRSMCNKCSFCENKSFELFRHIYHISWSRIRSGYTPSSWSTPESHVYNNKTVAKTLELYKTAFGHFCCYFQVRP